MTQLDMSVLYFIREHLGNPFLDILMPFLSFIGDGGAVWLIACTVMMIFKRTRIWAAAGLIAMLLSFVVGEIVMKNIFCRIRPCYIDTTVPVLVPIPKSYSFPSGHTASSFSCASAFLAYNKRIGAAAAALAALIGFSRLYNFVHFPSDVAVGALLGLAAGFIAVYFLKGVSNDRIKNRKSS